MSETFYALPDLDTIRETTRQILFLEVNKVSSPSSLSFLLGVLLSSINVSYIDYPLKLGLIFLLRILHSHLSVYYIKFLPVS